MNTQYPIASPVVNERDYAEVSAHLPNQSALGTGAHCHVITHKKKSHALATKPHSHVSTVGFSSKAAAFDDYSFVKTSEKYSHGIGAGNFNTVITHADTAHAVGVGKGCTVSAFGPNSIAANLGSNGFVSGGSGVLLIQAYFDIHLGRINVASAMVGMDGIKPYAKYRVDGEGRWIEVGSRKREYQEFKEEYEIQGAQLAMPEGGSLDTEDDYVEYEDNRYE